MEDSRASIVWLCVVTLVDGMTKDAFLDDIKTRSSVLYQLTVLPEAIR